MTIHSIQATFGRGELTPKLHSRADIDHFKMGLKTCLNWTVMRQGGIRRRPGTQFIGEVKDSNKRVRLIPFIFSASQAYVLEVGDGYFRVFSNGGRVGSVEVATPWTEADLFQLDYDQTNDVLDVTHKAYQPRRISRFGDTSWGVAAVPTNDGPYLPVNDTSTMMTPAGTGNAVPPMTGNTAPSGYVAAASDARSDAVRTFSAWRAFDQSTSRFSKWSTDDSAGWLSLTFPAAKVITVYIVQASTAADSADPNNLGSLNAPKSWTFEGSNDGVTWFVLDSQFGQSSWSNGEARTYTFTNAIAYLSYRINIAGNNGGSYLDILQLSMTESPATATSIIIKSSSTAGINDSAGFVASDVGRLITLLGTDATYHSFQIASVTSSTEVTAKLTGGPLPTSQGTLQWKLSAWGTTPGWPAHIATFEGRKVYARTDAQPSGLWATKSGGYGTALDFSVSVPVRDDDAISFTLTDVNEIQWIAEGTDLRIGTGGAARTMGRDSPNLPFSANNFRQSLASTYASQAIRPTKVGGSTLFASTFGKAMREFVPSDNGVGYDTPDISVLSEHLFASGIVELSYAQEPDSIVWLPNGKGELIGFTYEKSQAMAGMHRHRLGGSTVLDGGGAVDWGVVESVCTIPGLDRNEVWMVVRRTINGNKRRYIERMAAPFEAAAADPANAWYVDSGLQYSGAPVTAVSGLSHLEGQTVSILADGARETDQVVAGGGVSLTSGKAASNIIVGLPYLSHARTLPSPLSQGDGSGLGRRKKVVIAKLDLLDAGPLSVGRDPARVDGVNYRNTTDNVGSASRLFTGFADIRAETRWSDRGEFDLIAKGPQPCTVRSLTLALEPEP